MYFTNNIDSIWSKIVKHQNETFLTKTGIAYYYLVCDDYILINNDKRRKITKEMFKKAFLIKNPTPSKIQQENIWGPSYVYGIITDDRIK